MPSRPQCPPRGLTAKFIEALPALAVAYEIGDAACPGLRLRVLPTGLKVFRYYIRALNRVVTLGPWAMNEAPGHLTLYQARWWLGRAKEARRGGVDQLDLLIRELNAQVKPQLSERVEASGTLEHDLDTYHSLHVVPNRRRSHRWVRYLFRRFALRFTPGTLTSSIDKRLLSRAIEDIAREHRALAGSVLDNIKPFFAWAAETDRITKNPAALLSRRTFRLKRSRRRRSLKPLELPLFWNTLRAAAVGRRRRMCLALQVIFLTGVRVTQLCNALWSDFDFADATWTIPADLRKRTHGDDANSDDFVIPLSPLAIGILRELKELARHSPWVLPGRNPATHVFRNAPLRMLHILFGSKQRSALAALEGGPVTVHDVRRSMRTQLGRLRVAHDIAERCLDHSLGDMTEIYDQGDHVDERREAVNLLAQYVERLEAVPPRAEAPSTSVAETASFK